MDCISSIPKVLLLLCTFSTTIINLVNSTATSYCVDSPYHMEESICCGNKLQLRGVNSRCCEDTGEVYDAATQVCCGTVEDVARPWSVGCCRRGDHATLYNTSRQSCCSGNIHDTKRQYELTTGQVYEEDIMGFCCGTTYVDTSPLYGYDMMCCHDQTNPALSTSYNVTQSVCCSGRVQPRTDSGQCCGQLTYDPDEQVCCYHDDVPTILLATGYGPNQCCAKAPGGVISKSTHVCIEDTPYERECYPAAYNTVESSTLGCCAGYLSYNKTTHHCCGARVLPRGTVCCAGQPVLEGQVCCGPDHGAVTVSLPDHNKCCYSAASYHTYSDTTHTCHHGGVKQRVVCGGRVYDPADKACCNGVLSDTPCCAGRAVLEGQVCCGPDHGPVTVSNPAHNSCCYSATTRNTYNNTTHTCRHGEVQQRFTCGGRVFNPSKMLCCEGELYQQRKGYLCCGNRIYTPKYLTCCSGTRIQGAKRACH